MALSVSRPPSPPLTTGLKISVEFLELAWRKHLKSAKLPWHHNITIVDDLSYWILNQLKLRQLNIEIIQQCTTSTSENSESFQEKALSGHIWCLARRQHTFGWNERNLYILGKNENCPNFRPLYQVKLHAFVIQGCHQEPIRISVLNVSFTLITTTPVHSWY